MKDFDRDVVANMTVEQLIDNIRAAKPDAKDKTRAEDIYKKQPYSPSQREALANRQLQAITDTKKFYRRAHAFLAQGINCKLGNTIFYKCNTVDARNFIATAQQIGKSNRALEAAINAL